MTDQHDLDDLDDSVARHLARTLRTVAAATPVSDRRDAIADRLPPDGVAPDAVGPSADSGTSRAGHPGRPGRRRMATALAVAAVVLVVVALATVAIRRGDDGAVDVGPVEEPELGTGWYLPGAGWTVTAVTTERRSDGEGFGPLTTLTASETGDDPAALVVTEIPADGFPDEPDTSDTAEPIEVGGRPGSIRPPSEDEVPPGFEPDEIFEHVVHAGDRRLVASSRGVDSDVVIDVLDAWADRIEAGEPVRGDDLPLPEAMEVGDPVTKTLRFETVVALAATNEATGENVRYDLTPASGYDAVEAVLDSDRTTFDGDAFTVESDGTSARGLPIVARTGGAVDIEVGRPFLGEPEPDPDAIGELMASLRQVDTATWRAALEAITPAVDPDLLRAETLFAPPLAG